MLLLLAGLGVGCGPSKPVVVSGLCRSAWAAFDGVVIRSGAEFVPQRHGPPSEADIAATETLHRCRTPSEWWAGGSKNRTSTLGAGASRFSTLSLWCSVYEEAEPVVCLNR